MKIYDRIKAEISQRYYRDNYSNDGQRFIAWYLRNIYGLDEYETKDCVTDGPNDNKIDAVYIDHRSRIIYIIQGKFYSQKGRADAGPFMDIVGAWLRIKDIRQLQESANDKLCAKVSEILSAREDDYDLYFELVTPQELNQSVHKDLEAFINATRETQKDTELSENIIIVDEKILERRYNDAFNLKVPRINYEFRLEEGKYIYTKINGTKIVTAILKLRDCIKIPGIQDGSLFRKNIRQSLGKTVKVNREIARTLRNYPGDFFLLHNGITAICSRIEFPSHNVMLAEDISVVNGCQSLTTIYNNSEAIRSH